MTGFRRALEEHGLPFDERRVAEGTYEEASGRQAMAKLLARRVPFTGLVCANDEMAAGAIAVARDAGLYPYVVTVATRDLLPRDAFYSLLETVSCTDQA